MTRTSRYHDSGFTLVELLVVIVVLGVLATIAVFAVRGITDQGSVAAQESDERVLTVAEEAHLARFNTYADEATLVAAGLLTEPSTQHDITLTDGGESYAIVPAGSVVTTVPGGESAPTTEPPGATTVPTTFAGFNGESFGTGTHRIVVITDGTKMASDWEAFVAAGVPLPTTEIIWLGANDVRTTADVDSIVATGATYFVAAESVPITRPGGGTTYVGQYLNDVHHLTNLQYWWGHSEGDFTSMLARYTTVIQPGG